MLAAVQRERERIAVGVEMIADVAAQGRPHRLRRRRNQRAPGRPRVGRDAADVQHGSRRWSRRSWPAAATRRSRRRKGSRTTTRKAHASITRLRPTKKDVVVGVSASGMTQFVRGALTRARKAGARIIFVTCDPGTELQTFVDLTIAPGVGAEVIAGSTRLKAGTATKLVLNMLTTGAMVRIGKTYGNLMVDVADGIREAEGSRPPHRQHRHRPRVRRRRQAAEAGALEREGGDRHAEDRPALPQGVRAASQGARLDARGDRRGYRAAAEGHAAGRGRSHARASTSAYRQACDAAARSR